MYKYFKQMLDELPLDIEGTAKTPAAKSFYHIK